MIVIFILNERYNLYRRFHMVQFIISNLATIIIGLGLLVIVTLIIRKMIKDKKQGKGCCGSGCEGCSHSTSCH